MEETLTPDAERALRALRSDRGRCPSAESLVDYQETPAGSRPAHPAHTHIQICSRCQLILVNLGGEASAARRTGWFAVVPLAIAAVVLLAVTVPVGQRVFFPPPRSEDTLRGGQIQLLEPVASVPGVSQFRWSSPSPAPRYRIRLYRDSAIVWTSESAESTARLPSEAPLDAGVSYAWQIETLDSSGAVTARSGLQTFSIQK